MNLVLYLMPDAASSQLPEMVREKRVDGVILVGSGNADFLKKLQQYSIPTMLVDPRRTLVNCPKLVIDNESGAFMATEHLIEHGHRKIAFISGELSRPSFSERLQGYKNALTHYKLGIKTQYIRHHGFEAGYELTKSLLAESDPPTAIFCANDINAIYAYKAINEAGLQVGEDVSLVGFDDIDLGRLAAPALTTIRVYKEELGSVAVRQLRDIIYENSELHYTTIIPVKLIERDSVKTITQNH
jgi:LacI family transcriptional regulator